MGRPVSMCARAAAINTFFKRRNHAFTRADFRDNSGLQFSTINTDDYLINHLLRELFHASGRNMFREERIW